MVTAAEQYRALVEKLEAINPSNEDTKSTEIDPFTGQPVAKVVEIPKQ